jgi:purine-binding chemotaxis protein CheW
MQQANPAVVSASSQAYVVFPLREEQLGVPVQRVGGILPMRELAPVQGACAYLRGMLKLQDQIIPVIDLAARFGLAHTRYTQRTCIVVARVLAGGQEHLVGLIATDVPVLLNLGREQIRPAAGKLASCALGVAEVEGRAKILLDLDKAITMSDLFHTKKLVN